MGRDGLAELPPGELGSVGSPSGRNRGGGNLGEVAGVNGSGSQHGDVLPTGAGSSRRSWARSASGYKSPMCWTVRLALTWAFLIPRRFIITISILRSRDGLQDVKEA